MDATGSLNVLIIEDDIRTRDLLRVGLDRVRSEGYGFQVEMTYRAHRAGARIREVPIVFEDRRVGESKMSGAIFKEAVLMVPRLALGLLR